MRENGQIYRLWKKWGTEFSEKCLNPEGAQPLKFQDIKMAFTLFMAASGLALFLLFAENFVHKSKKRKKLSTINPYKTYPSQASPGKILLKRANI